MYRDLISYRAICGRPAPARRPALPLTSRMRSTFKRRMLFYA